MTENFSSKKLHFRVVSLYFLELKVTSVYIS